MRAQRDDAQNSKWQGALWGEPWAEALIESEGGPTTQAQYDSMQRTTEAESKSDSKTYKGSAAANSRPYMKTPFEREAGALGARLDYGGLPR